MPASKIVNKKNKAHQTALHIICSKFSDPQVDPLPFVRLLIDHKADVNILNNLNETALQNIPVKFYSRILNMEKDENKNILHSEVSERNKYINIVKAFMKAKCNINNLNTVNHTILDEVCKYDHSTSIVNILIQANANINKISRCDKKTPLFISIDSHNLNITKFLLKHKANVNSKNKNGITPLMRASTLQGYAIRKINNKIIPVKAPTIYKNLSLIEKLLEANADIEALDGGLNTALIKATSISGNIKIVQLLLDNKANPNAMNDIYETALSNLLDQNHQDILIYTELLIKRGAYINLQHALWVHSSDENYPIKNP